MDSDASLSSESPDTNGSEEETGKILAESNRVREAQNVQEPAGKAARSLQP
ncbi:hypothetical protein [Sphingomonas parva]|uniref:hypothetical protein n=1 Tax=Sphingomonas parva TaxID=2555898 RepID=UPI001CDD69FA|nr:hypothetical protein [Sphingomonas parva]